MSQNERDHFKECLNDLDANFSEAQEIIYTINKSFSWLTIKERARYRNLIEDMQSEMDNAHRFLKKDL